MTRYEEHGVRPGASLIRLSCVRDGKPWTCLYRYDTSAAHTKAHFESEGIKVESTRDAWDGKEYVCTDNGD